MPCVMRCTSHQMHEHRMMDFIHSFVCYFKALSTLPGPSLKRGSRFSRNTQPWTRCKLARTSLLHADLLSRCLAQDAKARRHALNASAHVKTCTHTNRNAQAFHLQAEPLLTRPSSKTCAAEVVEDERIVAPSRRQFARRVKGQTTMPRPVS